MASLASMAPRPPVHWEVQQDPISFGALRDALRRCDTGKVLVLPLWDFTGGEINPSIRKEEWYEWNFSVYESDQQNDLADKESEARFRVKVDRRFRGSSACASRVSRHDVENSEAESLGNSPTTTAQPYDDVTSLRFVTVHFFFAYQAQAVEL